MPKSSVTFLPIILVLIFFVNNCLGNNITLPLHEEIECLTTNLYFEGRDQSKRGKLALMFVVFNRIRDSRFPNSACLVVSQRRQFSWTNNGVSEIRDRLTYGKLLKEVVEVYRGSKKNIDPTFGSIFYYSTKILKDPPCWVKEEEFSAQIGDHRFYKDTLKNMNCKRGR